MTTNEFKSEAQREKFKLLVQQGRITQAEFDRIDKNTGDKKLPDRVSRK